MFSEGKLKESVLGLKGRWSVFASVFTLELPHQPSHNCLGTVGLFTATPGQIGSAQVLQGKGLGSLGLTSIQAAPPYLQPHQGLPSKYIIILQLGTSM